MIVEPAAFSELDVRDEAVAKKAIVPGQPEKSAILKMVTPQDGDVRMPKGKTPLLETEVVIITSWIQQGAEDDEHDRVADRLVERVAGKPLREGRLEDAQAKGPEECDERVGAGTRHAAEYTGIADRMFRFG